MDRDDWIEALIGAVLFLTALVGVIWLVSGGPVIVIGVEPIDGT